LRDDVDGIGTAGGVREVIRRVIRVGGWLIFGLLLASLVAGQLLGQPILLSYVTSGSMEPTIDEGDGFVAVPTAVTGPVEEGDVVVFQAEQVNGGQLTTHRVVGETEEGFTTRGDANPVTDQADGEPPVKRTQIVATALEVNGDVVVIPNLGVVVEGTQSALETVQRQLAALLGTRALLGVQGLAYLLLAFSVVVYAVDAYRESGQRDRRTRDRSRDDGFDPRLVSGAFALLLVLAATAAMVVPAGSQQIGIVSAEFESERPTVIERGESAELTYTVPNGGIVPVVVFLEPASEGIDVAPREARIGSRDRMNATVTVSAPPETGYYRRFFVEHRYLAILPQSTIRTLYEVHPWVPIAVIDALVAVPFYLLGTVFVGSGRLRRRERDGPSILDRLLSRYT
jgi:signal peptidase